MHIQIRAKHLLCVLVLLCLVIAPVAALTETFQDWGSSVGYITTSAGSNLVVFPVAPSTRDMVNKRKRKGETINEFIRRKIR